MSTGEGTLHGHAAGILLLGYGADLVLGDPTRLHPVRGFGQAAAALERALWRPRRRAGVLYAALLLGAAACAGRAVEFVPRTRARAVLAAASVWLALGARSLASEGRALAALVERGDLAEARVRARALVGRDTAALDERELCRAAVESIAENTADAVIGPLLWGAVAGPAGVLAYRAANTLDAMVGHRSLRYERFGWAAARLDDLLTWPAARLGALLAVALAPAVGGSRSDSWRVVCCDGSRHPSPNAGRLEAAFAGALEVRLGGANTYDGRRERRPTLGEGPAPTPLDVERAVRLSSAVGALAALLLALLATVAGARAVGARA